MAFGPAEPDVQLRPELSTNRVPVDFNVEQNAVAQLADAFRKGVVTADDLIERYGTLAKTKEKSQIQGLDEFISPEAIQSRQNQVKAANTEAILKSSPEYQAAQQAQLKATQIAAEQGDNASIRKVAIEHGFGGSLSPFSKIDQTQDLQAYRDAVAYQAATSGAKRITEDVNRVPHSFEMLKGGVHTVEKDPNKDILASKSSAAVYTADQTARANDLANMTPEQWVAAGKPTSGQYVLGAKPVEQPSKTPDKVVQPVSELVTPRQTTVTETTKPDGTKTVVRKTVEPTQHPGIEDMSPYLTSYKEGTEKVPTVEDKGKILGQIRVADEMAAKINDAQAIVHNEAIKPVGPGVVQGTQLGRMLAKAGAAVGNEAAVKKAEAQNQLDQFIAQSIQNTIRSMAGSGNRVMQAEIDPDTGLFTRANPTMSSTPATWDKWFSEMRDLFARAREDSITLLPEEERGRLPAAPKPVIPTNAPPRFRPGAGTTATPPITTLSTGTNLTYVPGVGFKYVK